MTYRRKSTRLTKEQREAIRERLAAYSECKVKLATIERDLNTLMDKREWLLEEMAADSPTSIAREYRVAVSMIMYMTRPREAGFSQERR